MLKIIATPPQETQGQAKAKGWLGRLFSATLQPKPTLDLSILSDYLKTEELEATAQELHRLLPGVREIHWPLSALDTYLTVEPKSIGERILIEMLSRHSQGTLSFADDSPSARESAPEAAPQSKADLTLFFSFEL